MRTKAGGRGQGGWANPQSNNKKYLNKEEKTFKALLGSFPLYIEALSSHGGDTHRKQARNCARIAWPGVYIFAASIQRILNLQY